MRHLWLSDCRSLVDHLQKALFTLPTDKRRAVELLALRQLLWQRDTITQESILQGSGDMICWVDTSRMLADCLTKKMKSPPLIKFMQDGDIDLTPTLDSLWLKAKKQAARAKGKPSKTEAEQVGKGRRKVGVPGVVEDQPEYDYIDESAHL